MNDWGKVYADCVEETARLAASLGDEDLVRPVPATPGWNVRDVLCHAAGAPADSLAGRMDGAPGPAWTGRQITERDDCSVADLIIELRGSVPAIVATLADVERPAIVWDKAVHLADLYEALGQGIPPESTWRAVLDGVGPWRLAELPLAIRCGEATFGAGGPEVTASAYELFRAAFSRRTAAEMRAWAGDTVSDEQLDAIGIFGPRGPAASA